MGDIFGEYSCLNGSDLYGTSPRVIEEWKQNKMILAQKQGSSKTDIELYCNPWKLPSTHPFYYDAKSHKTEEKNDQDEQEEEYVQNDRNNFSIWSSGWSANIIGKTYLKECGENV